MNPNHPNPPPARHRPPRRILAVSGLERPVTSLDGRSAAVLAWAAHWHRAHTGLDPQAGVLMRRALALYSHHLEALQGDRVRAEEVSVVECSKGSGTAVTLTEARARIEAADAARRPLRLMVAMHRPEELQQHAAMVRALDGAMAARGL